MLVDAPLIVTVVLESWLQAKDTMLPSLSLLAEPSSVAVVTSGTLWSGPAFATGDKFTGGGIIAGASDDPLQAANVPRIGQTINVPRR